MLYGIKSCAFSWVKNSNNFAVSVCIITIFVLVCIVVNQKKKKNDNDIEAYFYLLLLLLTVQSIVSFRLYEWETLLCLSWNNKNNRKKKLFRTWGELQFGLLEPDSNESFFFSCSFNLQPFFFVLWLFASLFCVMFILYRLILRNGNVTTQLAVSSFLQRRKLVECLSTCIETRCALEYLPTVMILICIC